MRKSIIDNPETSATLDAQTNLIKYPPPPPKKPLDAQDTGQRQTKHNIKKKN